MFSILTIQQLRSDYHKNCGKRSLYLHLVSYMHIKHINNFYLKVSALYKKKKKKKKRSVSYYAFLFLSVPKILEKVGQLCQLLNNNLVTAPNYDKVQINLKLLAVPIINFCASVTPKFVSHIYTQTNRRFLKIQNGIQVSQKL